MTSVNKGITRPRFAYVGCFTTEKRKAKGKGIAVFRIDHETGKLAPTGQVIETGSPTCIVFATK